jgi:hypothetical protein
MKLKTLLTSVVLGLGVLTLLFMPLPDTAAQSTYSGTYKMLGWGWSSTIGWFGFGGDNQANVHTTINMDSGQMSGNAWSSNVGWVNLNPSGPYPADPQHGAKLNKSTNTVEGWARATTATRAQAGGWDGWIKMSGSGFGVRFTPGASFPFGSGLAWGSLVDSWVSMHLVKLEGCEPNDPDCDVDDDDDCPSGDCDVDSFAEASCSVSPSPVELGGSVNVKTIARGETLPYKFTFKVREVPSFSRSINISTDGERNFPYALTSVPITAPGLYNVDLNIVDSYSGTGGPHSATRTCSFEVVDNTYRFDVSFAPADIRVNRPPHENYDSSATTITVSPISGAAKPVTISISSLPAVSGYPAPVPVINGTEGSSSITFSSGSGSATFKLHFSDRAVTPPDANISSPYNGVWRLDVTATAPNQTYSVNKKLNLNYFDPREQSQ